MTTTQFLLSAWTWNPVVLMCRRSRALAAYLSAFRERRRSAGFCVALARVSAHAAFAAQRARRWLLSSARTCCNTSCCLLIVPALLLAQSAAVAFPCGWRPRILAHPLAGWIAGVGAMWFWHAPTLCNAAVSSRPVHALQTVSLLAARHAFLAADSRAARGRAPLAARRGPCICSAPASPAACSGSFITFSPVTVCSIYTMQPSDRLGMLAKRFADGWGLTPEKDQQIGGLLMWVPMCLIYLSAIFAQIARWFANLHRRPGHSDI